MEHARGVGPGAVGPRDGAHPPYLVPTQPSGVRDLGARTIFRDYIKHGIK